jgi:hypothetical protein
VTERELRSFERKDERTGIFFAVLSDSVGGDESVFLVD